MNIKDKDQQLLFINDRFTGKYDSMANYKSSMIKVLKWRTVGLNEDPKDERPDKNYTLPTDLSPIPKDIDCIVWLGHSSFFIRIGGKTILIDPIIGNLPMVPRMTPFIHKPTDFGEIDYLLISHGHYDHLDKKALLAFAPYIKNALLPSKMGKTVKKWLPDTNIQEAVWFDKYKIDSIDITFLPAKHWSKRSLFDDNKMLWGAFAIQSSKSSIFFAGDTAYDDHFKEISKRFGGFKYCLIPIGAYKPASIMKRSHVSPIEAVKAFNDLKGENFIPMHYGTFLLSSEPTDEPLQLIKDYDKNVKIKGNLIVPKVGEVLKI